MSRRRPKNIRPEPPAFKDIFDLEFAQKICDNINPEVLRRQYEHLFNEEVDMEKGKVEGIFTEKNVLELKKTDPEQLHKILRDEISNVKALIGKDTKEGMGLWQEFHGRINDLLVSAERRYPVPAGRKMDTTEQAKNHITDGLLYFFAMFKSAYKIAKEKSYIYLHVVVLTSLDVIVLLL